MLLLGIAQGLFLAVLLRQRHWKLYANRFLAAMMASYGLLLLNLLLQDSGFHAEYPKLWLVLSGLPFLSAPLHFLYAQHLIHPERRFRGRDWLHALPFVMYKITEIPMLVGPDADMARILADFPPGSIPEHFFWFNWIIVLQGVLYMGGTLLMLLRHARGLEDVVSSAHHLRLTWLRNITLLSLVAWVLFMTEYALYLSGVGIADRFGISGIFGGVLVYVMGYLGLSRSEVLEAPAVVTSMTDLSAYRETTATDTTIHHDTTDDAAAAYAKSGLDEQRAKEIAAKLRTALEEEHVYRDSGLTLPALAERLDVSAHNLSEAINTQFGMNFFDLVNGYRVREVQDRLADAEARKFTILALAFDAGFNSKTSFNTIFKKHTGMTPSQYRDAHASG